MKVKGDDDDDDGVMEKVPDKGRGSRVMTKGWGKGRGRRVLWIFT